MRLELRVKQTGCHSTVSEAITAASTIQQRLFWNSVMEMADIELEESQRFLALNETVPKI
jgi:hypothetical protein